MIAPWNAGILQKITADRDRMPHSWLFCGPPGLGKNGVACRYSEMLLGEVRGFSAASHPDFHVLCPEAELDPEGSLLQRYGMRYYVTKPGQQPKSVISVDQVRALSNAIISFGHGSFKVVLITPAHKMNINAANALLKSLEEPPTNTVFILVSDRPDLLPATILSRCSRIDFRIPPRDEALTWLSGKTDNGRAAIALDVARGAPLLAEEYLNSGFLDARDAVIRDIQSVMSGRIDVTTLPGRWKDLGVASSLSIFYGVMSDLVKTRYMPKPPGLINPDQLDWLHPTSKRIHLKRVFALLERVGRYLQDTNSPLDKNLLLEDLFLDLIKVGIK